MIRALPSEDWRLGHGSSFVLWDGDGANQVMIRVRNDLPPYVVQWVMVPAAAEAPHAAHHGSESA